MSGSAYFGVFFNFGVMVDVGDVDVWQRVGLLCPLIVLGSGYRTEPKRSASGQGNRERSAARGAAAGGRPPGSARGGTIGAPGSGTAERAEAGAKCSREKRGVSFKNPNDSSLWLPGLTNLAEISWLGHGRKRK